MKKGITYAALSAMTLSAVAVAPVGALAADAATPQGIYDTVAGKYYSFADFNKLTKTQKADLLKKAGVVTVYNERVLTLADIVTATSAQLPTAGKTVAAYEAETGKKLNPTPAPAELKVESVSAINANEVKITFNQELDKTTAETVTNYTINGKDLITANDKVTLQDDKKSVIIKFNGTAAAGVLDTVGGATFVTVTNDGQFNNNTAYTVGVKTSVKTADNKNLATAYSTGLFFADSVKPSVSAVTVLENGNLQVKFNERYGVTGTSSVYVDGTLVNTGGETLSDDTYNGYYTIPKANITAAFTAAGKTYEAGKTYSVIVSGFTDFVGNVQNLYTGSVTNTVTSDAPSVTSVVAKDEKTLELTFSEEITGAVKTGVVNAANITAIGLTSITKNNVALAASTVTTTDGKKFTINLPAGANAIYDGSKNETSANLVVKLTGYKDLASNVGVTKEQTVTVTKDTVKPSVTKAAYTYTSAVAGDDTLVVTLSELTTAKTGTQLEAAGMYITDANGIRYDVNTAGVVSDGLAGDATDKTFTILVDHASLGLANGDYVLHIPANAFNDQGVNTGNGNDVQTVNFKVTGSTADTAKPTVGVTAGANNGQITVTYNEQVKGGSITGSATDLANYQLNGAALPTGTTITLNAARTIATITLPSGAIETTGARSLTVSGVQDLAGNVITTDSQAVAVTENKKPEVTAAKVVNGELVLTFSENVDHVTGGTATAFAATDFEVKVNGVDVAENLVVRAAGDAKNALKLTATDASFATGTITVKVLDAATATDAAGNAVVKASLLTATR